MVSLKEWIVGKKSVITVTAINEQTRDGINKAYIPKFLYKPPFGYPRYANMPYVRWLAQTPYVEMCIDTILNEVASIEWDIVPTPGWEDQEDETEKAHIKNFFLNPNTNDESFEDVFIKMPIRDVLEVNSGVLNKVYNLKEELVEVVARDGATFTKNPDIHGMYTYRDDIIISKEIIQNENQQEVINPFQHISQGQVREKAAYFQYGWIAGPVPVPFGKKEILWMERMKRTDDHYGYSPVQTLAKALQRLLWDIDTDLEYYNDNNTPKGIIGLDDSDSEEIEAFKEQWYELQRKKDEFGNWKKLIHKVPIVNKVPNFTRIEFSSEEMQLIEKQKWYTKMVWACFGVTPTELGYTEDAKGSANQIVQSKVFKKKAVNPVLRMLEYQYNKNIVSEFGYNGVITTKNGRKIEVPRYTFKFMIFDSDEERNKAELYKLWVENGLRTVNEIRTAEGLDEVEWGDDPPSKFMSNSGNSFNFGNGWDNDYDERQQDAQDTDSSTRESDQDNPEDTSREQNTRQKAKEGIGKRRRAKEEGTGPRSETGDCDKIESKPFAGYTNFDECVAKNSDKKNPKSYCAEIMQRTEGKAATSENPLILKEGERPVGSTKLEKAIVYVLKQNEKEIIEILKKEMQQNKISEVKDLNDLISKLKSLLSFEGLRRITNEVIRNNYIEGWDQAEKGLNRNFMPEKEAIDYLQKYTFENIKGMEDDIANKLRQELQRSYMDGEGLEKIKSRIKKVFDVGDNRAEMIARTETSRASNVGKLQAYQKSGEKGKKVYIATKDDRTSPLCRRLDGQEVDINANFKDPKGEWEGPSPPAHVNCRSTWAFKPDTE